MTAPCRLSSSMISRALRGLLLALMFLCGTSPVVLVGAAEPGPQWITPRDGEVVVYLNDLVFEVAPVNGSVGYLYGFFENGQMVWENWANERPWTEPDTSLRGAAPVTLPLAVVRAREPLGRCRFGSVAT